MSPRVSRATLLTKHDVILIARTNTKINLPRSSHLIRNISFLFDAFCSPAEALVSASLDSDKHVLRRFVSARDRSSCAVSSLSRASDSAVCCTSLASLIRTFSSRIVTFFLAPESAAANVASFRRRDSASSACVDAADAADACVSDL